MNPILLTGISVVNIALVFYTTAFIIARRKKIISKLFFSILLIAVSFDITATTLMIIGSSKGPLTLHGIIGYTSLGAMIFEAITFYLLIKKNDFGKIFSNKSLKVFTFIFIYWVLAYITGAILIMLRN
ncbi:MAG TPA: hypothetical protein PKK00_01125 [Bacteroidales bacterium]|nr:hypothetical protein [Bacteroidales bacterium]HPS16081.1 hypothetical protein [Bacteroidales bacterium]